MGSQNAPNGSTTAMDVRGLETDGNQVQRGTTVRVGSLRATFRTRGGILANLNEDRIGLPARLAIRKGGGLRPHAHHRRLALSQLLARR